MAENHVYGELATTQCYNACRQLLKDRNGYECGAEEGTFLAAFSSGTDALQFCVVVSSAFSGAFWGACILRNVTFASGCIASCAICCNPALFEGSLD